MASISPERLRDARETPNVLKVKLAQVREFNPNGLVIVVEGKDDVAVYELWIKRIDQDLEWEPLVSKGKKCLLDFRDLLWRDQTNLRQGTFFICDHDYDALRTHAPGDDIYVLPGYSVENFVVMDEVFGSVLRTVFQMRGDAGTRASYIKQFDLLYDQFIALLEPCCAKLYAAKRQDVGNVNVDDDLNGYLIFSANMVGLRVGASLDDLVTTEREVEGDAGLLWAQFVDGKDKRQWIRGKFVLFFFRKACHALFNDWNSESPMFGDGCGGRLRFNSESVSLEMLAARSPLPAGLEEALGRWIA